MWKCRILPLESLFVNHQQKLNINSQLNSSLISPCIFFYSCFICQFFVEEPTAAREDVSSTGPPEVLVFTSHMNVTNESFPDSQEDILRGDKFYLPVGLTVCVKKVNELFIYILPVYVFAKPGHSKLYFIQQPFYSLKTGLFGRNLNNLCFHS